MHFLGCATELPDAGSESHDRADTLLVDPTSEPIADDVSVKNIPTELVNAIMPNTNSQVTTSEIVTRAALFDTSIASKRATRVWLHMMINDEASLQNWIGRFGLDSEQYA